MSTTGRGAPPARVRVTGPTAQVRRTHRTVTKEIDAQTELGALYMRSLMRAQLRLAVGVLVLLGTAVGLLPVAFRIAPHLASRPVLGMPLAWGLLGFVVYPLLVALGWTYVRRAERNERAFTDMVEES